MRLSLILIACAVALTSLVSVASAQGQSAPPAPPSLPAPGASGSSDIPDAKLDAAAAAVKSVSSVKDDYEQRIARAPQEDKERIATEGTQALEKAVTEHGLSVAEYTAILEVAQNDPAVRDKILQRLK